MKKIVITIVTSVIMTICPSCDTALELMQGMGEAMSGYSYGSDSYYSTGYSSSTPASYSSNSTSESKEWHDCTVCGGTGNCRLCKGSGKSKAKDGKCHACDRTGNGKCAGCKGKGGWYI